MNYVYDVILKLPGGNKLVYKEIVSDNSEKAIVICKEKLRNWHFYTKESGSIEYEAVKVGTCLTECEYPQFFPNN